MVESPRPLLLSFLWLILLFGAGVPTWAGSWEIVPTIGLRGGGSLVEIQSGRRLDFDATLTYALTIGRAIRPDARIEGTWSHQPARLQSGPDLTIDLWHVAGVYEPPHRKAVGGYVLASLGLTRFALDAPDALSETLLSVSVGGGGRFKLSDRLSLRLEGRAWVTFTSANVGVFCGGGCLFAFAGDGFLQLELSTGLAIAF